MVIDRIARGLKRDYYWLNSAYKLSKTFNSANNSADKSDYEKLLSNLEEARQNLIKYTKLGETYGYETDILIQPVQLLFEFWKSIVDVHFDRITKSEFMARFQQLRDKYEDYCSKYPLNKQLQLEFNI